MTSTEANEFFAQRTEEEVGGSTEDTQTDVHRSSFQAKQSTAQARKKSRSECRLVVQYVIDLGPDRLKELSEEHGRQYVDAVDYGRALLRWLDAEGKTPQLLDAEEAAFHIKYEVEK